MIDNQLDTNNVKFTAEQTEAVEESKRRLLNLESEISIASKNLKVIKAETEKAIKEKSYQEDLLANINGQVISAQNKFNELNESIIKASDSLSSINQEIAKKSDLIISKEKEFKDREDNLETQEKENITFNENLNVFAKELSSKEEDFNTKVANLKGVISSF